MRHQLRQFSRRYLGDGRVTLHSSDAGLQFNLALVERARHRIVQMLED